MKRISTLAAIACSLLLVTGDVPPSHALPATAAIVSSSLHGAPDGVGVSGRARRRGMRRATRQRRRPSSVAGRPETATGARGGNAGAQVESGNGAASKVTGKMRVEEIKEARLVELLQPVAAAPRPLLVNFWATWCEPCRKEFPDLVKIDGEFRARGLEFITISLDDVSEIASGVPQFLQEMRATRMPAFLLNADDSETAIREVDRTWRGELPATFLYDRNGKLVFKHMGRINAEELRTAIKEVMADR